MAHGNKLADKEIIEIYNRTLKKKRNSDVPYVLACKTYGLGWTDLKKRIERIKAKKMEV